MRLDIHVHIDGPININMAPSDEVPAWAVDLLDGLEEIFKRLGHVQQEEQSIMTNVADLQAKASATLTAVQAETDVVNAVKQVVDNSNSQIATLKQQLADAIAAGCRPGCVADAVRYHRRHPGGRDFERSGRRGGCGCGYSVAAPAPAAGAQS
jgi:hypothetical protein